MVIFKMSFDWLLKSLPSSIIFGAGGMATIGIIGGLDWFLFNNCWKTTRIKSSHQMKGVALSSYRGPKGIEVREDLPVPKVLVSDEVLIKVIAVGLDSVDLKISWSYGESIRSHLRRYNKHNDEEFPIVLGRQCSGIVADCGQEVESVSRGEAVFAVSPYCHDGLAAEYAVVKESQIAPKPTNLSFEEAACLPYAAIKIWNAITKQAKLGPNSAKGKRILVFPGNSPGGLFAIQLLKAWGAHVTTIVPTTGLPMCHELNVDDTIVYSVTDYESELRKRKRFDVVVNTVGTVVHQLCVEICNSGGKVVTLVSTAIITDRFGLLKGSFLALIIQIVTWIKQIKYGTISKFWWDNFAFDQESLKAVSKVLEEEKILPIIETVFELDQAPEAFRQLALHNAVGSTVIKICPTQTYS